MTKYGTSFSTHHVLNMVSVVLILLFANSSALGQETDEEKMQQLGRRSIEAIEKEVKIEELKGDPLDYEFHIRNLCTLLSSYALEKQTVKAEATYKKILDLINADSAPDGRSKANLMIELARACSDWGKYDRSEAAYRRGLAMVQNYEGDRNDKNLQAMFLTGIGEACLQEGKLDEAQRYLQQVYDYKHSFVADLFIVAEARLAETYRCKKNYAEAERLFKESLASFPYDHYTLEHYAQLLRDMGRTSEAQSLSNQEIAQKNSPTSTYLKRLLLKSAETTLPTAAQPLTSSEIQTKKAIMLRGQSPKVALGDNRKLYGGVNTNHSNLVTNAVQQTTESEKKRHAARIAKNGLPSQLPSSEGPKYISGIWKSSEDFRPSIIHVSENMQPTNEATTTSVDHSNSLDLWVRRLRKELGKRWCSALHPAGWSYICVGVNQSRHITYVSINEHYSRYAKFSEEALSFLQRVDGDVILRFPDDAKTNTMYLLFLLSFPEITSKSANFPLAPPDLNLEIYRQLDDQTDSALLAELRKRNWPNSNSANKTNLLRPLLTKTMSSNYPMENLAGTVIIPPRIDRRPSPNIWPAPVCTVARAPNEPAWFGPYRSDMQRRIKKCWWPPTLPAVAQSIVTFRVSKDGRLNSLNLKTSSGDLSFDKSCLRAVQNSTFRVFPTDAPDDMDFQMTFLIKDRDYRLDLIWISRGMQKKIY